MIIRENKCVCPGYYRIVFAAPSLARFSFPGQFCLLSIPGVFLRRPFSIHSADDKTVSFLYRVVGKGTQALSTLVPGTAVTVFGPLGKGYDSASIETAAVPLLVAGGTGIASLHFLAERLPQKGILFYGARSKKDFVCLKQFRELGWQVKTATEDGTAGYRGYVTDLFAGYLAKAKAKSFVVYTCGPVAMMKKIAAACRQSGVPGFASMEEMMACGVGNCQGCAVKVQGTYKMACKAGPVFSMNDIDW